MGPAAMLVAPAASGSGKVLLVVAGDRFLSVKTSLEVAAKASLPSVQKGEPPQGPPEDDPDQGPMPPRRPAGVPPVPAMGLVGRTLYVMRGDQITAIKIDDGSLSAQATLPRPEMPHS